MLIRLLISSITISWMAGLFGWFNSPCFGQSQDYYFESLSLDEGLSQNTVQCMLQDSKGFLWIGTANGLNRYDGYSMKIFKKKFNNENCISNNDIRSLYEDRQGNLWIGTAGGLNVFKADSGIFRQFMAEPDDSTGLSHNFIRSISEDRDGFLWIGTARGGLDRYDPKGDRFTAYRHNDKLPWSLSSDHVTSVSVDRRNRLWIATWGGGINYFDSSKTSFISIRNVPNDPATLSSNQIHALAVDTADNIWIATEEGLDKLDAVTLRVRRYGFPSSSSRRSILSLHAAGGHVWIGTHDGLYRLNTEKGEFERRWQYGQGPVRNQDVLCILTDRSGMLWVGTSRNGILKMHHRNFSTYRYDPVKFPSFINNNIWAFAENRDGRVWIGADENIFLFDPVRETIAPKFESIIRSVDFDGGYVNSIIPDGNTLWLGTPNGLLEIDQSSGRHRWYRSDPLDSTSLSYNSILCLGMDGTGNLWVGTSMGLNRMDRKTGKFRRYMNQPGRAMVISHNTVLCLFTDPNGTLWSGTLNGLNRYDAEKDQFRIFRHDAADRFSLSAEAVLSVTEDREGHLWIGTGSGLNVMDRSSGRFRHINEDNGLPDDVVYGMLFDEKDDLWLSSNKGLSKITRDDLSRIIGSYDASELKLSIRNYDERDGLQADEFNSGAYLKTSSGDMYFGGLRGFNKFRPSDILYGNVPPAVWVTSVRTADKEAGAQYKIGDTIELSYDQNTINFEFVALDFTAPSKNRYAYRLEGVDESWHYAVARRYATYSNLDPGQYVFRVNGANSDLVWNMGQPLRIVIHPPFWKTWWFYSAVFFVMAVSAISAYKYRVRQHIRKTMEIEKVRRMENERVRKKASDDFHDEFGHTLTKIAMLAEVLKKEQQGLSSDHVVILQKIVETSKMLSTGMRDFLWALNPSKDTFAEVAIRIKDFGDELFDRTGTAFFVDDIPANFESIHLSMQVRRHTILIYKEAMHNILKHAKATRADLTYKLENGQIVIRLSDNGIGLDPSSEIPGLGLRSMQRRAGEIKADLKIAAQKGAGTTVTLTLHRSLITNGALYEKPDDRVHRGG